jgi:hypothetical protein
VNQPANPVYVISIPAILAATVLVAGLFAFMPIEKASTVHTTITAVNLKIHWNYNLHCF